MTKHTYMMRTRCKVCGADLCGPALDMDQEEAIRIANQYTAQVARTESFIHICQDGSIGMVDFIGMQIQAQKTGETGDATGKPAPKPVDKEGAEIAYELIIHAVEVLEKKWPLSPGDSIEVSSYARKALIAAMLRIASGQGEAEAAI